MARIVIAWELGAGSGHLDLLFAVSRHLATRGHEISLVSCHPRAAHRLFHPLGIAVYPAPLRRVALGKVRATDSYAQMLLDTGYADSVGLAATLRAWRDGFARLQPDLVIADFAPTAMLAARHLGVKVAAVGQGYTLPPATRPLPFARPWEPAPRERLVLLDAAATASINAALIDLAGPRTPRLSGLADLFDVENSFLCTFPELDHYPDRGDAAYFGPIYVDTRGVAPRWPDVPGPRIFAYANSRHPTFAAMLSALTQSGYATVLHASGLTPSQAASASASTVQVSAEPIRLRDALAACDAVVCQGIGTASAALVAGKPVLLMPEYLEQEMTLHCVDRQKLGVGVSRWASVETVLSALRFVLNNPVCRSRAADFATHYHGYTPDLAAEAVAEGCDALCHR
jgi:UDP:flavonoid glycosyltransferase YjiC (YdhE family)